MKKFKVMNKLAWALCLAVLAVGCKDDEPGTETTPETEVNQKFFVAATAGTATYMLTVDDLESGTASIVGNGIEEPYAFTAFVNNGTKATVAMQYRQGDPAIGMSYGLNTSGSLVKIGNEFQMDKGYTTWGTFGDYVLTARSGQTLTSGATGAIVYFVDVNNQNAVTSKEVVTTNMTGNGLTATLSGLVDGGNGEFLTSLVLTNGNVDSVYVAALDENLTVKRIYKDNRLSYSAGRYRSAYYSQIDNDDDGNTYVFSGSYESTTTKPAGAIRINQGATTFDPSYYFNIQELSGGYRFRKVWHVTEDYFLLEFYNDIAYSTTSAATQYAIVKMEDKTFTWLTSGFPAKDQITATGWPFSDNGKLYLPVTTASAQPTVYVIDPKTATAKAGLVIEAEGVSALAKFTY